MTPSTHLKRRFRNIRNRAQRGWRARSGSASYWSVHSVADIEFESANESREYTAWRNDQYLGYADLMPVNDADDLVVLDYGCGPGNDLVGYAVHSSPARLIGTDVSPRALELSQKRLLLEDVPWELYLVDEDRVRLPLEDNSVDLIHSSGVLHHCKDDVAVIREFYRILKPGGRVRLMVYNYDSIWVHLYVAYILQIREGKFRRSSLDDAFRRTTDGKHCPIARYYTPGDIFAVVKEQGFRVDLMGCAISVWEMMQLGQRFEAIQSSRLAKTHREFLTSLEFNKKGIPTFHGIVAGLDACYLLQK